MRRGPGNVVVEPRAVVSAQVIVDHTPQTRDRRSKRICAAARPYLQSLECSIQGSGHHGHSSPRFRMFLAHR